VQFGNCISAFPLLQCKIIALVVNKLVCSRKQFDLTSLLKKYFDGSELVPENEEQWLRKDVYCLHFRKSFPHSVLLFALKPFHLTISSVAIAAIPFRLGSGSAPSCSMRVRCSSYQELAIGSLRLTAYRLRIFIRRSGVCAGHTVFCSIGTGVNQPEREDAFHLRPSAKMKDKPAVPVLTVHIAAVVRDRYTFTFCY
jgi:hypothetical protein